MFFQTRNRLRDHLALLAEGEAYEVLRLVVLVEDAERNERHAGLAHQAFAENAIGLIGQSADVGGEEVGAFARQRLEAEPRDAVAKQIALSLQFARQLERELHLILEPIGN